MKNTVPIINQYGKSHKKSPCKKRIACRGIILKEDKILVLQQKNTGMMLLPGGGLENGESYADCCKREVLEETGFVVNPVHHFLTVNEYYEDRLYETHFFFCEIVEAAAPKLTEHEILAGACAQWVKIDDAVLEFGNYAEYENNDPEKSGQYRREEAALRFYLENVQTPFTFIQRLFPPKQPITKTRVSARAIINQNNKILFVNELCDGTLMSTGGGLEECETIEECCKREVLEETGYIVTPKKHFLTVNEYFEDTLYVGVYFICEITGNGKPALTSLEKEKKTVTKWVDIDEAIDIFKNFTGLMKIDEGKESLYTREYTVLKKYKELL